MNKSNTLLAIFAVLTAFLSCKESIKHNNDITMIALASGDCYGSCAQMALAIDSNLNVRYYGGANSELKRFY